ncbi:MAG: DUF4390 domain-containing protein [Pseudomonadota bacterium]
MIRHCLIHLLSCAVLMALGGSVWADEGKIIVRFVDSELVDGVHEAEARVQFQLSDRIEEALANGITLRFELTVDLSKQRRWWPDANVATITVINFLRYNAVSQRYTLRNENTGRQRSFATIFAALNSMGRIDSLPLIDAALLEPGARYRGVLHAEVTIDDYPLSLRYLLFWRDDWRVRSSGFAWSLAP